MFNGFPILEYVNAIWGYRLLVICTLVVGLILTVTTVTTLPDVYTSTTLIMVEPQDVPESYVKATTTLKLEKRLQAMNQEVLSRTRLEQIIKDFDLFKSQRSKGTPMESLVDRTRKRVKVEVFPSDNAFRISYDGSDPKVVQQVTARLASMYIDENLRIREEHASGTTEFMESELEKARRQLEEQEGKLQAFKQKYMGELPEQQAVNMQNLEGLRAEQRGLALSLTSAQERKAMIERQISDSRAVRPVEPGAQGLATSNPGGLLRQLEASLADLRTRYTDAHPDVIRTQSQIARLKEQQATAGTDESDAALDPFVPSDLQRALVQVRVEISRLQADEERVKAGILAYQQRVENAFVREQQIQGLSRDYAVTQRKYQGLLDKKLEAQMSQSLEHRQKAERFRMLDPASMPQTPTQPNRPMLMAGGALLSLALALGLPILLVQLDSSFHGADGFAEAGLPVLAVIPQLETTYVRLRQRTYRRRVLLAAAATLVIGLGAQQFLL